MHIEVSAVMTVFGFILLTELGDKTQLAAFSLASTSRRPWTIFISSTLAFFATSLLAAFFGRVVSENVGFLSVWLAPLLFIVFGIVLLLKKNPPIIYDAFAEAASQEAEQTSSILKELKKRGLLTPALRRTLAEEKGHEKAFEVFIKKKFLYSDDINEEEPLIKEKMEAISLNVSLKKSSDSELINDLIRTETASLDFYSYLLNHLLHHEEHRDEPMIGVLENLIEDEKRHITVYMQLKEDKNL